MFYNIVGYENNITYLTDHTQILKTAHGKPVILSYVLQHCRILEQYYIFNSSYANPEYSLCHTRYIKLRLQLFGILGQYCIEP